MLTIVALCLVACCDHVWIDATCDVPQKCSVCGLIEGQALEHMWENSTCTTPQKCAGCGLVREAIGHTWSEATCLLPKVCDVCSATEGSPLGHSTPKGVCSRCEMVVNDLEMIDGFAIITYDDLDWMQKQDDFIDVCVSGTIVSISKYNDVLIVDSVNGEWTVAVGTACDLSSYIGTECRVFGFSSGGISSSHKTPLINMNHDDNRIAFFDGKKLYPKIYDSVQQFDDKYNGNTSTNINGMVWIPTDGGKKYHSKSNCSNMDNPQQVTLEKALEQGFTKCGKCWS